MEPEEDSPTPPSGANPPAYASHPSEMDRRSAPTAAGAGPQQPLSLPSIHQLPFGLPSTSAGAHRLSMVPPHAYATGYEAAAGYSTIPAARHLEDSEQEGGDLNPPKKKRRRQALSCTECKRRKIKCDRAQPCGPCSRRGEQNKCQWHIIEPMEKYVTRAEYDDLKARFDNLEATVARVLPALSAAPHPSTVSPNMPIASTSAGESSQTAVIPPFRMQGPIASPVYRMSSPQPAPRNEPPFSASSSMPPRSPQASYRLVPPPHPHYSQPRPSHTMPSPPSAPRLPSPGPPLSSSSRLPDTRLPSSRRASLSLAAITTPYSPTEGAPYAPAQSKNRRAQTLPLLGQRLRKASAFTGPAAGLRRRRAPRSNSIRRCCIAVRLLRAKRWGRSRRRPQLCPRHRHRLPLVTFQNPDRLRRHTLLDRNMVATLDNHTAILATNNRPGLGLGSGLMMSCL